MKINEIGIKMSNETKQFNLEKRTSIFGENVIEFCGTIRETSITRPLISQIIRSATSIGANYQEANGASSKKDFKNKIYICKKEAQETGHWLRMLQKAVPEKTAEAEILFKEVQELTLIFGKIVSTMRQKELDH
jgi:four helix bundle protein